MKAVVLALAASVSESAFGDLWRKVGALLDIVIPIVLFFLLVLAAGAAIFGFVH